MVLLVSAFLLLPPFGAVDSEVIDGLGFGLSQVPQVQFSSFHYTAFNHSVLSSSSLPSASCYNVQVTFCSRLHEKLTHTKIRVNICHCQFFFLAYLKVSTFGRVELSKRIFHQQLQFTMVRMAAGGRCERERKEKGRTF